MADNKLEKSQEYDIAPELEILITEEKDSENKEKDEHADCY